MNTPPKDAREAAEYLGMHYSASAFSAGRSYKLFLSFLNSFVASGFPRGRLEFTCPKVEEAKKEIAELRAEVDRLKVENLKLRAPAAFKEWATAEVNILLDTERQLTAELRESNAKLSDALKLAADAIVALASTQKDEGLGLLGSLMAPETLEKIREALAQAENKEGGA